MFTCMYAHMNGRAVGRSVGRTAGRLDGESVGIHLSPQRRLGAPWAGAQTGQAVLGRALGPQNKPLWASRIDMYVYLIYVYRYACPFGPNSGSPVYMSTSFSYNLVKSRKGGWLGASTPEFHTPKL